MTLLCILQHFRKLTRSLILCIFYFKKKLRIPYLQKIKSFGFFSTLKIVKILCKYVHYLRFCKIQVDLTNLPILPKFPAWYLSCPISVKILETLITFYTVHFELSHWCMTKLFRIRQIRQQSLTAFCKTSIKCDQVKG